MLSVLSFENAFDAAHSLEIYTKHNAPISFFNLTYYQFVWVRVCVFLLYSSHHTQIG